MSDISQIDGAAVRLKRESQGWVLNDLATRACLSVKQIRQIEEGGMSAFYSESVKLTAARKVASLLDMTEAQLFGQEVPPHVPAADEAGFGDDLAALVDSPQPASGVRAFQPQLDHAPITRSEALHVLAQPPEHLDETSDPAVEGEGSEHTADPSPPVSDAQTSAAEASSDAGQPASGGISVLKVVALFVVALAAAAIVQTKVLEKKADEPATDATLPVPADASLVPNQASTDTGTPAAPAHSTEPAPAAVKPNAPEATSAPAAASSTSATPPASAPAASQ
jgi:transcriptional regulator with XRE-family HTH domain